MLKRLPILTKLNIYPICLSGSLKFSTRILNKPYKIKKDPETIPVLTLLFDANKIKIKNKTIPSKNASYN